MKGTYYAKICWESASHHKVRASWHCPRVVQTVWLPMRKQPNAIVVDDQVVCDVSTTLELDAQETIAFLDERTPDDTIVLCVR